MVTTAELHGRGDGNPRASRIVKRLSDGDDELS